ncbi:MAG: SpoIIE family protein phosphatase [Planctomycetota bacterium]
MSLDAPKRPRLMGWKLQAVRLGVAVVYLNSAFVSEQFATQEHGLTPVWTPAGIALGAALIFGLRIWPGVFIASVFHGWLVLRDSETLMWLWGPIVGATLEVAQMSLAAYAVVVAARGKDPLHSLRGMIALIGVGAVAVPSINGALVATLFCLDGRAAWSEFFSVWITWAIGTGVAVVVVTPFFLAWRRMPRPDRSLLLWGLELVAVVTVTWAVDWLILNDLDVEYLKIPPLVWAAFRLGAHGSTVVVIVVATGTLWSEIFGERAFQDQSVNQALILLQAFIGTVAVLPLVLVATLTERRAANEKQARLTNDLEVARAIQRSLLPQAEPNVDGFEIAGWSRPADQTGGDFYDWISVGGGRQFVMLGDVTGHGIGPALVTASCRAYVRAEQPNAEDLSQLLTRVNSLLAADLPDGRFITFFAAVVHPDGSVEALSAGHGPICVCRGDEIEILNADGPPLGVIDDLRFDAPRRFKLKSGERLAIVTDGFTEWASPDGELFGNLRLADSLRASRDLTATEAIASLERAVSRHARGTAQADDLTALVIKRL